MNEPINIEKTVAASATEVWHAITDVNAMRKWYFDIKELKFEKGFDFGFYGENAEGKKYLHLCCVTEVIPLNKLSYSWKYDGYQGISNVTFELSSNQNNSTLISLTHSGVENFEATNPDFARKNFEGGWAQIVGESLPNFLKQAKT